MKRLFLLLLFGALLFSARAQTAIRAGREGDNIVLRVADKEFAGSQTILLTLSNLKNCNRSAGTSVHCVQQEGQPLLTLRPIDPKQRIGYNYTYRVYDYRIDPQVDTAFVYRMPCAAGRSVRVGLRSWITDRYSKSEEELAKIGTGFLLAQGDTIYAMRRGIVTRIERPENERIRRGQTFSSESFRIWVEHPDGSIARYSPVDGANIFVSEGDRVLPSTPLALVGTYDGELFHTAVVTGWVTFIPGKDENGSQKASFRAFLPRFATTEGDLWPQDTCRYTPAVSDELIRREMSKREIKRLTDNKR